MVVPFPPGGASDLLARVVSQKMTEAWGQPVVVDNRAGAAGMIGSRYVSRTEPNGYTLVMAATGALDTSGHTGAYEVRRDFEPIALVAAPASILVVHPDVPAKSVAELIALAKKKPGDLNFSSSGAGAASHLAGALFNSLAGIDVVHVPYKGAGPAMMDVMTGQITYMFAPAPPALPQIKSGKLRALGVTSLQRSELFPEIPAISESGLPGYDAVGWFGLLAPPATPKPVVDKINAEVRRILKMTDVKERLASIGAEPADTSPQQFAEFINADTAKWAKVVPAGSTN